MDWLEITVNTTPDEINSLSDRLELLGVSGLVIEMKRNITIFWKTTGNSGIMWTKTLRIHKGSVPRKVLS